MTKKTDLRDIPALQREASKFVETADSDFILHISREYALYVIMNRAIPYMGDGLADAARKAMWVMMHRGGKIKTGSLNGAMVEQDLYVHSDAGRVIAGLAGQYVNNLPLLKAEGNFGSRVKPNAFGAFRYTYVDKPSYINQVLYVDRDCIELEDNYAGTNKQPVTFLPLIPLMLVNGHEGIAVGWATDILPRRVEDVIDGVLSAIDGRTPKAIPPAYVWCDSPCSLKEINENKDSVWEFTGRVKIVDTSTAVVTELPPTMKLENFRERLIQMEDKGLIKDHYDRSTKQIKVEILFPRGTLKGWTEDQLIEFLKLKSQITEHIVTVDFSRAKVTAYHHDGKKSPEAQLITDFVRWRFSFYEKRYKMYLKRDSRELDFWRAVVKCFKADMPGKLRGFEDKASLEAWVQKTTGLDDADLLDRLVGFAAYRWTKTGLVEAEAKIKELEARIAEWKEMLRDDGKRWAKFKDEVRELKTAVRKASG